MYRGVVSRCKSRVMSVCSRADTKESRETGGKLKSKHKLTDASSDGERAHKESRHDSYGKDQHRDDKRSDAKTSSADVVDTRQKDRSHRTDVDADSRGDGDRAHRDQLTADDVMSGSSHRRSADTAAVKPADDRGTYARICMKSTYVCVLYTVR